MLHRVVLHPFIFHSVEGLKLKKEIKTHPTSDIVRPKNNENSELSSLTKTSSQRINKEKEDKSVRPFDRVLKVFLHAL